LLGVLKREHYRKVLRSKTVNLSADEFDFVNKADALPVTGKTMLASDLASELDCEFVAELEECS
jgi:deoxyadenosine/deoxycytidine kinase